MSTGPSLDWFAGVFDVSGYAGLIERSNGRPHELTLRIERQEAWLPELFAAKWGGTVQKRMGKKRGNAKARWIWARTGRSAQAVMLELLPHLRARRMEVERLCAFPIAKCGRRLGSKNRPHSIGNELQRVSA